MKAKFRNNKSFQELESVMDKKYFDTMLKAIKTSENQNLEDEKKAEINPNEDQRFLEIQ